MTETDCMIKELKKMAEEGITHIEIYYAEDMEDIGTEWSIDVMQNRINDNCRLSWCWTIISLAEDLAYRDTSGDDSPPAEYEIIIDEPFSTDIVCEVIQAWLCENGLGEYNFIVDIIDLKAATPYSGYLKSLMNRDIDSEIQDTVELEAWLESN